MATSYWGVDHGFEVAKADKSRGRRVAEAGAGVGAAGALGTAGGAGAAGAATSLLEPGYRNAGSALKRNAYMARSAGKAIKGSGRAMTYAAIPLGLAGAAGGAIATKNTRKKN